MRLNVGIDTPYHGKRVLVTGNVGFKGRHLVEKLRNIGSEVRGFDIADNLLNDCGDVRDFDKIASRVHYFRPDFIFHLAAQAFVPVGFDEPLRTFETNAQGTVNLLEAIRTKLERCAVVVVTTDKVYGDAKSDDYFDERDLLRPRCPYSASKIAAEHAVAAYRDAYWRDGKIAVATARAGNVIGPGDWGAGRLIPNAVKALRAGTPAPCYNPHAVRPWQHVEDVIDGYLRLGAALYERADRGLGFRFASAWNFGPDEHHTVSEVLEAVCKSWGSAARWSLTPTTLHEVSELRIDSSKARGLLNWKPKWTFEKMIDETVKWYKANPESKR